MRTKPSLIAVPIVLMGPAAPASGQVEPPAQTEVAKLVASDAGSHDKFGFSLDLDGDTLVIGAPSHYSTPTGPGSVYFFLRDGGTWNEMSEIFASDGLLGDEFGHAVSLDGDTLLVGAPFVEDEEGAFMGAAYVFARGGDGAWSEVHKFQPADIAGGDFFGDSVALDGDTAVIAGAGAAYVFARDGQDDWSRQAVLQGLTVQSVALDGATLLAAGSFAPGDVGALVYVREGSGWTQEAELHLPAGEPMDPVVVSVAVHGDTAVIGRVSLFLDRDEVYAFVRSGPGAWSQELVPRPEDVIDDDVFGISVDVSGERLMVGASHHGRSGAAWVYGREAAGSWSPQVKLVPSDFPSSFGFAVALDAMTPVVGAWADPDAALFAGSAYVFADVATPCLADLVPDGSVGIQDLLALLAAWGTPGGDVNGDATTGILDLLALLAAWGPCG